MLRNSILFIIRFIPLNLFFECFKNLLYEKNSLRFKIQIFYYGDSIKFKLKIPNTIFNSNYIWNNLIFH